MYHHPLSWLSLCNSSTCVPGVKTRCSPLPSDCPSQQPKGLFSLHVSVMTYLMQAKLKRKASWEGSPPHRTVAEKQLLLVKILAWAKQSTPDLPTLKGVPSLKGKGWPETVSFWVRTREKFSRLGIMFGNVIPRVVSFTTQLFTQSQTLRGRTQSSSFLLQPPRSALREDAHWHLRRQGKGLNRSTLPNAREMHLSSATLGI